MKFEDALDEVVDAADAVLAGIKEVGKYARKVRMAAVHGKVQDLEQHPSAVREAQDGLERAVSSLVQSATQASRWPSTEDGGEKPLAEHYLAELCEAATAARLPAQERPGQLLCFPSTVSMKPADKVVFIDQKKVVPIRPTKVVGLLRRNSSKRRRPKTQLFRCLYQLYLVCRERSAPNLPIQADGPAVGLDRIFKLYTVHPQAKRECKKHDFARDLFLLDNDGPKTLKIGKKTLEVVLGPPSSGSRQTRGIFSFIGPDGHEASYYTIQFREAG